MRQSLSEMSLRINPKSRRILSKIFHKTVRTNTINLIKLKRGIAHIDISKIVGVLELTIAENKIQHTWRYYIIISLIETYCQSLSSAIKVN